MQFNLLNPKKILLSKMPGQILKLAMALHMAEQATSCGNDLTNVTTEINVNTFNAAVAILDYATLTKFALMVENESYDDELTQQSSQITQILYPPFKKPQIEEDYNDTYLTEIPSSDIIKCFPLETRKVLAYNSDRGDHLPISTAVQKKFLPPRKSTFLSPIARSKRYSAWRTRVFFWHLERKGLGSVIPLYPKRSMSKQKSYFEKKIFQSLHKS